jgi:CubicO group peptidase (beta-lactamase class C family)
VRYLRAIGVALIILLTASCRTTTTDRNVGHRLDALFGDLHLRNLFDGAVVVGDGHHVIWEKGFGFANVEQQVLFTPETPADAASLAKTLTATLLIMLDAEGILDLDASAQRLLPELPYPEITLRHLLSHSSGLPVLDYDYFDPFIGPGQVRTTEALLSVLEAQRPPLASRPETAFEYSSFGYDLAALAAARAARKPFADLLDERIFRPLGIRSAFVRPGRLSDFPGVRTLGYRHTDAGLSLNDVFDTSWRVQCLHLRERSASLEHLVSQQVSAR